MKLGAVYPQIELAGDPAALDAIGRAIDAIGYDHLVLYDHVVGALHEGRTPPLSGPYTERDPFHDPFTAFAYLAGVTKRIDLVSGILILPQRQTVLVAKQAADVDLLSGGRFHMGVGTGWNYVEYDALGQDFASRGARLDEQIPLLRRLWTEQLVSFNGRFDSIDRACVIPRPRHSIPLYCGGSTDPAFRRAVAMSDGFIFAGGIDKAIQGVARLRQLLAEAGRADAPFRLQWLMQTPRFGGLDIDAARAALDSWKHAGGTHASVVSMGLNLHDAAAHIHHFEHIWRMTS